MRQRWKRKQRGGRQETETETEIMEEKRKIKLNMRRRVRIGIRSIRSGNKNNKKRGRM